MAVKVSMKYLLGLVSVRRLSQSVTRLLPIAEMAWPPYLPSCMEFHGHTSCRYVKELYESIASLSKGDLALALMYCIIPDDQ